jgi:hypothetical protein
MTGDTVICVEIKAMLFVPIGVITGKFVIIDDK